MKMWRQYIKNGVFDLNFEYEFAHETNLKVKKYIIINYNHISII